MTDGHKGFNSPSVTDKWHDIFKKSKDPIFILSGNKIADCNQAAVEFFELNSFQDCLATHPSELSPVYQPDGSRSHDKEKQMFAQSRQYGSHHFYWVHQTVTSKLRRVFVCLTDISTNNEEVFFAQIFTFADYKDVFWELVNTLDETVSSAKGLVEAKPASTKSSSTEYELLHQHKRALDMSAIVSKTDPKGVITYVNDYFCKVSGYSRDELIGNTHKMINHPEMPREIFRELWKTIMRGDVWQGVIQNRTKTGKSYYVSSTITPILNRNNEIEEFISIRHDITELYEKENIILSSLSDSETKLGNKAKLLDEISVGAGSELAICQVNELNDIQGIYSHGDYLDLLMSLSDFFKSNLTPEISIYRVGVDRFAFLVNSLMGKVDLPTFCLSIAENIKSRKFSAHGAEISLSTTFGVSTEVESERAFNNASLALDYACKSDLPLTVFQRNDRLQDNILSSLAWIQKISSAIRLESFEMFGQKICHSSGEEYSTEMLLRYKEGEGSYISPDKFLDYARKARLYDPISQIVIRKVFAYCANTQNRVSINIERNDIYNDVTCQLIFALLEKTGLGPLITFELVESQSLDMDSLLFLRFVEDLKKYGCLIAIDDFGSGYSNFDYLTKIPVDILKIDGSLIKDICENEKHLAVVGSIVSIAHTIGLKVTAEFVENQIISEQLCDMGVDYQQGYYFDKPKLVAC
ncbi:GGDEF domain-containing phosphodiesterase [uncultured Pseudoteredinibacter sp.]|uniref:bifunctional diguanylate cyclase/phosphodiesterase n=1 Tax=uncultured Pseudoteredinibacter sp. TaxID=1641701 RepID=UPI0026120F89|nr:GGDEF domain-containing phosphodiesterase [uncultured Pseudoteredinibacter sp.]